MRALSILGLVLLGIAFILISLIRERIKEMKK